MNSRIDKNGKTQKKSQNLWNLLYCLVLAIKQVRIVLLNHFVVFRATDFETSGTKIRLDRLSRNELFQIDKNQKTEPYQRCNVESLGADWWWSDDWRWVRKNWRGSTSKQLLKNFSSHFTYLFFNQSIILVFLFYYEMLLFLSLSIFIKLSTSSLW